MSILIPLTEKYPLFTYTQGVQISFSKTFIRHYGSVCFKICGSPFHDAGFTVLLHFQILNLSKNDE